MEDETIDFWKDTEDENITDDDAIPTSNVKFTITLDTNLVDGAIIILTPQTLTLTTDETTGETIQTYVDGNSYKLITNNKGTIVKTVPRGEYKIHAEYTDNQQYTYDLELIKFASQEENVNISLYRCDNETVLEKNCKYFLHEPYMTPNNYDLYFNHSQIPVNNIIESPSELHKRLQRTLPLTKLLHLNLEVGDEPEYNTLHLHTRCKLSYGSLNSDKITFKITGVWNEDLLMEKVKEAHQNDYQQFLQNIPSLANTLYNEWYDEIEELATTEYGEYLAVDPETSLELEDFLLRYDTKTLEDFEEELRNTSFEDFVKDKNWGTDSFKIPITVYMVRVDNEEENVETLVLDNSNNYELYTTPLPSLTEDGVMIKYKLKYTITNANEDCTITLAPVNTNNIQKTIQLL